MKSKLLVSFAVIVALVVGFFLGRWQIRRSVDSQIVQMSTPEVRRAMADFSKTAAKNE